MNPVPKRAIFPYLVNPFYFVHLAVISLIFEIVALILIAMYVMSGRGKLDDAFRIHNWSYGRLLIKGSWPYLRVQVTGRENIPKQGPYLFVVNHRTYADIFFTSMIPVANQVVTARSWVYSLWLFGWAMRLANYIEIEKQTARSMLVICQEFAARNVSFQFYPEGHRSRNGKLQRFRTGPFLVAADNNLPIIPVCMEGIEDYLLPQYPFFKPATVRIHFLPAVYPDLYAQPQQAIKLRKHVKKMFKDYLQE